MARGRSRLALTLALGACGRLGFGDASAVDAVAATPDGASPDAAVPCEQRPGVLFCDSFEVPGLAPWTSVVGDVTDEPAQVHRGAGALRVAIAAGPALSYARRQVPGLAGQATLFARTWLYVPGTADLDHINLVTISAFSGEGMSLVGIGDVLELFHATPDTGSDFAAEPLPRDRWTCLELDVVVDGAIGALHARVDGVEVAALVNVDTETTDALDKIDLGITYSSPAQAAATLYFDDVAIGTAPIGCD